MAVEGIGTGLPPNKTVGRGAQVSVNGRVSVNGSECE